MSRGSLYPDLRTSSRYSDQAWLLRASRTSSGWFPAMSDWPPGPRLACRFQVVAILVEPCCFTAGGMVRQPSTFLQTDSHSMSHESPLARSDHASSANKECVGFGHVFFCLQRGIMHYRAGSRAVRLCWFGPPRPIGNESEMMLYWRRMDAVLPSRVFTKSRMSCPVPERRSN
jgi:hypothetical protein